MATSPITPSVPPGNYYSNQTVSFAFDNTVSNVALTTGLYPPTLSKYIAYDTLTPPGPFIAVTEDGKGKVLYDGGFPKLYNTRMAGWNGSGSLPTTFDQLIATHKYFHNVIKWIANPAKAKKVLVIGDRDASHGANYQVKSTSTNGFNITLSRIALIAGYTTDFKDTADYPNTMLDMTPADLNPYAAVLFVGSSDSTAPRITKQAVDNLVAYREAGGGIFMITDHGYDLANINDVNNSLQAFFKTVNMVASRFGAYFTGNFDRTAVNVGFLRNTYGNHPVYNGLLDSEEFSASGSESIIVVTETTMKAPSAITPVTTSTAGMNQINLMANLKDGNIHTEKFLYNVQQQPKPYEMVITNAGRAFMNAAIAAGTPITNFEVWGRPGTTTITATTTAISGLVKIGTPEIASNLARTTTSFFIHLSAGSDTFWPRTLAIMSGTNLLAAISIDMVSAGDNMNHVPLLVSIDPKAFMSDTNNTFGDVLSAGGFNGFLNAVEQQRNTWMPVLSEGHTLYGQGIDKPTKSEPILVEVDVVATAGELAAAKLNVVSMLDVFNTWTRFSHRSNNYSNEDTPSEMLAWQYDAANDLIRCTINSNTIIGFVSPNKVKNYDLDVTMGSTDGDDDTIGVIACANYVNTVNGNELRMLDYFRSPGGNGGTAGSRYNTGYPGGITVAGRNTTVKWGNGAYGNTPTEAGYSTNTTVGDKTGWKYAPNGTRILIKRRENIVTMITSELNSDVLVPASEVVIDLSKDARFAGFMGSASYGFICHSQLDSYWKVNSFTDYDKVIVDVTNNQVHVYDGTAWRVDAARTPSNVIKPGRFAYSVTSKKLFYRDGDGTLIDLTK